MATSHSCIKLLKTTCEIVFTVSSGWNSAISQRCFIKEMLWKTSQNSQINTGSSHPEVFCEKKRFS